MKIIDKRTDYYDYAVQATSTPVWTRTDTCINTNDYHEHLSVALLERLHSSLHALPLPRFQNGPAAFPTACAFLRVAVLGYCGKLLPLFHVYDSNEKIETFLNLDDAIQHVKVCYPNLIYHPPGRYSSIYSEDFPATQAGVDEWSKQYSKQPELFEIFSKFSTPLFHFYAESIKDPRARKRSVDYFLQLNPSIRELNAQRCFETYTLYQDLEQYLSNELVSQDSPNCAMTDELKRDSKGFDKFSFKNAPGKKRKNNN